MNKAVEDFVFQLVPEFLEEIRNQRTENVQVRQVQRVEARKPDMRRHNQEFQQVIHEIDQQEDNFIDDTDEGGNANKIVESMTKKELKNHIVERRFVDSMGIKLKPTKELMELKVFHSMKIKIILWLMSDLKFLERNMKFEMFGEQTDLISSEKVKKKLT
eukprot:CAMPEP_0205809516 /NCGR_PEP_ID=MMETSP0205-20121125/13797_1 /ASSEMBLY_ACC=CAM_ASM_000278 /TAXON_ID=36767 /ORGANISM="Euplotes focardii, Strain TN1" /LENGTH=159 /DNA_ID=CAMNT_0053086927 /DNA_START=103 /DNA_END=583 /DNA_ORIENTATION=+